MTQEGVEPHEGQQSRFYNISVPYNGYPFIEFSIVKN